MLENINIEVILVMVGMLTALTNIVVQVIKQVTWNKLPTNILVLLVAMVLCLGAFVAYAQVNGIPITWYLIGAVVVLGFLVAFAAMFGFDKLKEALSSGGKPNVKEQRH